MHDRRSPSRSSPADATGQTLSKKARTLARIRPFVQSFAASISAPAPAQQLKYQPLTLDDSSREAATASGLAIVKVFFEDMERSTCAFFNEDANCEYRGRRQLARARVRSVCVCLII